MKTSAPGFVILLAVSAFSAFPSPFYKDIALASPGGLWAAAALFSVHGVAVIVAMSAIGRLLRLEGRVRRMLVVALVVDALGGAVLAVGFSAGSLALLFAGRMLTGFALGAATPVLTEAVSRSPRGTMWATCATLGGVGVGALAAAGIAAAGPPVPIVFVAGALLLVLLLPLVRRVPAGSGMAVPFAPAGSRNGGSLLLAVVLVFLANGMLGLFTSLVPAVVIAAVGGGTLAAAGIVAASMIGAGSARLLVAPRHGGDRILATATALAAGAALFVAGLNRGDIGLVVAGSVLLGGAAGFGYDSGMWLAIGSKVDALARVRAVAKVQRAGQLGLVLPALAFPLVAGS